MTDGSMATGGETILIAEDEEPVRQVLAHILSDAGYRVLQARDGVEAAAVFKAHAAEVALVLMDRLMPRQGGVKAMDVIRTLAPHVKIVLSSGYGYEGEGDSGEAVADSNVQFLAKPYEPADLLRTVRESLDRPKR